MEAIRTSIDGPFDQAVERVKSVFQAHGFGTLSQVDVRQTLHDKIDHEIEPYTVLGVCTPDLAARAIAIEHEIGVIMPCPVLVHQCDGKINVAVQDPRRLVGYVGNEGLTELMQEMHDRVSAIIAELGV